MSTTVLSLADKADAIMRDLELENLRAQYRHVQAQFAGLARLGYFYTEAYEYGLTQVEQDKQVQDAIALNQDRRIVMRMVELAASGIRPRVVAYGEPGNTHLIVLVKFSERGRRTLERSGLALSELLRLARKYLWIGYWAIAIVVVAFMLWDRIARMGWWQTLAVLLIAVAFTESMRRFWRRKD